MSKNGKRGWSTENLLDDIPFVQSDAETFQALLQSGILARNNSSPSASMLKGRIAELTKDFVVVDVGLKSEGLVPISEFSDPSELYLGNEVEVFLDQAEDSAGQIVLSREKAERHRQWENIIQNCEEGSIVTGKIIRKVKGGLMVDIGMEA
ncbi:MAG: S1 RNA-binding domain-containing protein, partial [Chlamydiae bacterium]|nr:S1 RNA-binding domain-containing protein [Chlamydiota bacterium]